MKNLTIEEKAKLFDEIFDKIPTHDEAHFIYNAPVSHNAKYATNELIRKFDSITKNILDIAKIVGK